ncbi:transposase [Burkholderia plantarii]|uniref:transposase n=1 Tax=Burkholderia plantarii TaxID=41899 RepID=UPI001495B7EF
MFVEVPGCDAVSGVSGAAPLNGILHVLQTGIPWKDLPQAFGIGIGIGMTFWRRLRKRHERHENEARSKRLFRRRRAFDASSRASTSSM